MSNIRSSRRENATGITLYQLLDEYQEGLRQYARILSDRGDCMDNLVKERRAFKALMEKATGTARGWTNPTYELLTIEFLKCGLRDRIEADWKLYKENKHYAWSGTMKGKQLKILPNMTFGGMKPDVRVALGEKTLAIVETKSSIKDSTSLDDEINRLREMRNELGKPTRLVLAVVYYGGHWKGGLVKNADVRTPPGFCFVCAKILSDYVKDRLGVEPMDILDLIGNIRELLD